MARIEEVRDSSLDRPSHHYENNATIPPHRSRSHSGGLDTVASTSIDQAGPIPSTSVPRAVVATSGTRTTNDSQPGPTITSYHTNYLELTDAETGQPIFAGQSVNLSNLAPVDQDVSIQGLGVPGPSTIRSTSQRRQIAAESNWKRDERTGEIYYAQTRRRAWVEEVVDGTGAACTRDHGRARSQGGASVYEHVPGRDERTREMYAHRRQPRRGAWVEEIMDADVARCSQACSHRRTHSNAHAQHRDIPSSIPFPSQDDGRRIEEIPSEASAIRPSQKALGKRPAGPRAPNPSPGFQTHDRVFATHQICSPHSLPADTTPPPTPRGRTTDLPSEFDTPASGVGTTVTSPLTTPGEGRYSRFDNARSSHGGSSDHRRSRSSSPMDDMRMPVFRVRSMGYTLGRNDAIHTARMVLEWIGNVKSFLGPNAETMRETCEGVMTCLEKIENHLVEQARMWVRPWRMITEDEYEKYTARIDSLQNTIRHFQQHFKPQRLSALPVAIENLRVRLRAYSRKLEDILLRVEQMTKRLHAYKEITAVARVRKRERTDSDGSLSWRRHVRPRPFNAVH